MKIALLSNVNMNFVIRSLKAQAETYEPEGYGNELGFLQNPGSTYHAFAPDITFFVMDYMEVLGHSLDETKARETVDYWFASLENCLLSGKTYYISDARLFGAELLVTEDAFLEKRLLAIWDNALENLCKKYTNVRVLPLSRVVDRLGIDASYSLKTWYLGKILLSSQAQNALAELILEKVQVESYTPKKVLVLDLDNTLWGGLAGENDHTPINLSEDHKGLAYKNLQRVLLQMQKQGVLLAIASKNNEADAMEIIKNHPHMVLRPEHFASMKINWNSKCESIESMAKELNLGLDSFVFFDDSGAERTLVSEMLPQVTVPDFPEKAEDLAPAMAEIYRKYFAKPVLTKEDLEKTAQYAANSKREQLKTGAGSFEEYLKQLQIVITKEDVVANKERLLQLLNKTNQFNLTTVRHTSEDLQQMMDDPKKKIYLFRVEDRFGDNGIVAALIADINKTPIIEEFVMSCRVMGRNVEQAILDLVEQDFVDCGFTECIGLYQATAKNTPVAGLYKGLGYEKISVDKGGASENEHTERYRISLADKLKRIYEAVIRE